MPAYVRKSPRKTIVQRIVPTEGQLRAYENNAAGERYIAREHARDKLLRRNLREVLSTRLTVTDLRDILKLLLTEDLI